MLIVIILATVFVAVAALIVGVTLLMRGSDNQAVTDRLNVLTSKKVVAGEKQDTSVLNHPLDDMPSAVEQLVSKFLNIRVFLEQGAVAMPPSKFLLICGGLALVGGILPVALGIHFLAAPFIALTLGGLPFV